jgi:uridine kinase
VILEGILVLSDPALREMMDLKIYVDADADDRLARRILRDVKERKRDLEGIIRQYQNTVKPMHSLYVEPAKQEADIVLNGGTNEAAFAMVEAYLEKQLQDPPKPDMGTIYS